jgi:hypothetical protein
VDPGVGAAGSDDGAGTVRQAGERRLQLALDRALVRLELPAVETGAVVVDGKLEAEGFLGFHGGKVPARKVMSSDAVPPVH